MNDFKRKAALAAVLGMTTTAYLSAYSVWDWGTSAPSELASFFMSVMILIGGVIIIALAMKIEEKD